MLTPTAEPPNAATTKPPAGMLASTAAPPNATNTATAGPPAGVTPGWGDRSAGVAIPLTPFEHLETALAGLAVLFVPMTLLRPVLGSPIMSYRWATDRSVTT
jgi:hypothetical protein